MAMGTRKLYCLAAQVAFLIQGGKTGKADLRQAGACSWTPHGSPYPLATGNTCSVPISQATAVRNGDWSPWSHRPDCLLQESPSSPQYCLYTDATFRGNRGISILTTPQLAVTVADVLDDSFLPPHIRDHPSAKSEETAYKVEELPGRGKGIVAQRQIPQWEVITVDYPVIITANEIDGPSEAKVMALLDMAVEQLPKDQQEIVWSLARSTGGHPVRDILKTNVFSMDINGISHIGLFPLGSRLNHNCQPNTFWRYSPESMAQEVVALRDIEAGEEITHCYTPPGATYIERKRLLSLWNINCTCSLCSSSPEKIMHSDGRRARIVEIQRELLSSGFDNKRLGEMVDEFLFLIDKEQLWALLYESYQLIASAYLMREDFDNAGKYIVLADEAGMQYGIDHGGVEGMQALRQELKAASS